MLVTIIILIIVIMFAVIDIYIEGIISKITVLIATVRSETFFPPIVLKLRFFFLVLETPADTGDVTAEWKSNRATETGIADDFCAKKLRTGGQCLLNLKTQNTLSSSLSSFSFGPSL